MLFSDLTHELITTVFRPHMISYTWFHCHFSCYSLLNVTPPLFRWWNWMNVPDSVQFLFSALCSSGASRRWSSLCLVYWGSCHVYSSGLTTKAGCDTRSLNVRRAIHIRIACVSKRQNWFVTNLSDHCHTGIGMTPTQRFSSTRKVLPQGWNP